MPLVCPFELQILNSQTTTRVACQSNLRLPPTRSLARHGALTISAIDSSAAPSAQYPEFHIFVLGNSKAIGNRYFGNATAKGLVSKLKNLVRARTCTQRYQSDVSRHEYIVTAKLSEANHRSRACCPSLKPCRTVEAQIMLRLPSIRSDVELAQTACTGAFAGFSSADRLPNRGKADANWHLN